MIKFTKGLYFSGLHRNFVWWFSSSEYSPCILFSYFTQERNRWKIRVFLYHAAHIPHGWSDRTAWSKQNIHFKPHIGNRFRLKNHVSEQCGVYSTIFLFHTELLCNNVDKGKPFINHQSNVFSRCQLAKQIASKKWYKFFIIITYFFNNICCCFFFFCSLRCT